jgi:hypothetical protein
MIHQMKEVGGQKRAKVIHVIDENAMPCDLWHYWCNYQHGSGIWWQVSKAFGRSLFKFWNTVIVYFSDLNSWSSRSEYGLTL